MPIYNYQCKSCKTEFEKMKPMSDRAWIDPCPSCGESDCVEIIIKSPRIVTGVGNLHSKIDSDFRDNLNRMKKFWKNSTIHT